MFWGTWVCAVKCTIDCAPKHMFKCSTIFTQCGTAYGQKMAFWANFCKERKRNLRLNTQ